MSEHVGRRALWTTVVGIAIGIAGVIWDNSWHGRHADTGITGLNEVFEAHWLIFVGILVIAVSLSVSVASCAFPSAPPWRPVPRSGAPSQCSWGSCGTTFTTPRERNRRLATRSSTSGWRS